MNPSMKPILTVGSALALLILPSCGGDEPAKPAPTPAQKKQAPKPPRPKRELPVRLNMPIIKATFGMEPSGNKLDAAPTEAQVALGRTLFHNAAISASGEVSCATCHDLANYGQDGAVTTALQGDAGDTIARNAPTVWNAARQMFLGWAYEYSSVEEHAVGHATSPRGLGLASTEELVAKVNEDAALVAGFEKAFPGGNAVTAENFGRAIGAFERTLVTRSKWDEFLDGNARALSNAEKKGLKLFYDAQCFTCHMGRTVGGTIVQKLGVHKPYHNQKDTGRHTVTGDDGDKMMFKAPNLLNVAKTAPYNHDGLTASLADVVKQMADIQLNRSLSDDDVAAIVAFLEALTGELPADIVGQK